MSENNNNNEQPTTTTNAEPGLTRTGSAVDELASSLSSWVVTEESSPPAFEEKTKSMKPSEVVARINQHLNSAPIVRKKDKIVFTVGVFQALMTAFLIGFAPKAFYFLYTFKAITYLPLRFLVYKKDRNHYFLLDFCYYANVLVLLYIWVYPDSVFLFRTIYLMSVGPLLWSVLAFRNSLVFHSLDKITSVFIHLAPSLFCWTARWHSSARFVTCETSNCNGEWSFKGFFLIPLGIYAIWAVLYYIYVFVFRRGERGMTLYKYLMEQKGAVYGLCQKFPPTLQPLGFLLIHLFFVSITMLLGTLTWFNFYLHTLFIIAAVFVSAWNGSSFYFEVFARRYEKSLENAVLNNNGKKD